MIMKFEDCSILQNLRSGQVYKTLTPALYTFREFEWANNVQNFMSFNNFFNAIWDCPIEFYIGSK